TYTLENDTEGVKAQVKVTVDEKAPTNRKPEQVNFNSESRSGEPYRALAERYAPLLAQETWFQPKSDFPTRFDYDNDFIGDNNWDNLDKGTSQAYVYYAAMETATHWFLIYNVFHPRDYSDKCVAGSCHENDNEGLILAVEKNGSESGKLLTMETLAHNNVYSFTSERSIRNGVHDIDGRIDLYEGSHPVVFIESGGHGIYGAALARNSRYNFARDEFTAGTGVTFVYKGAAERPKHPNDRKVGYDLLPILSHWWARASRDRDQRMFDDFGPYEPLGGRPGIPFSRIGRAFLGRKESANKAKPFWGWHDVKTTKENVLAPGQWGLDPAYAVTRDLRFPADMAFSLDYVYNQYLGSAGTVITAASPAIGPPGAESGASILPGVLPSLAEAEEGWIEVQAVVDGSVVLHIEGQQATPEVLSGQPLSESKFQFSGPPPSVAGARWSLEKTSGRGQVKIVEEPSVGNGMTLKVRVDDPQRAADKYVFRVRWKRN
ncbi:MAG: hypothetical protein HY235_22235, partial [Acidobacteria bacterium]|nr:hypothetical protein [Acidobacteriota bacterium]